jgi:DNA-binding GntR family transcriptional regulator
LALRRSSAPVEDSDTREHSPLGVSVTRRQRQREQIVSALRRGHYARVLVLCREHLIEFPDDVEVQIAADEAERAWPPEDHER